MQPVDATRLQPGTVIGLTLTDGVGAALSIGSAEQLFLTWDIALNELGRLEREVGPRWLWWSKDTARTLIEHGIRPAKCWDLSAVHRLLFGSWHSGPAQVWALLHDLEVATIPTVAPVDLFSQAEDLGDTDDPVGLDGHLRPEWVQGEWTTSTERLMRWAALLTVAHARQADALDAVATEPSPRPHAHSTALSESAAELLCAEMEVDGLPFDHTEGEAIIAGFVGPRPANPVEAQVELSRRDHEVLQHLPAGMSFDLRSPDQVKSLLRRVGIEVPDTRAWRLEALHDAHPIVTPLLRWRRAERILTTFGYTWIDDHVGISNAGTCSPGTGSPGPGSPGPGNHGSGHRLRGSWSGSDGAAGRMTATAGLHNMPAELRPAISADDGYMFVRSDLGQIEPRILAAVSGDPKLAAATQDDDMYAPVAAQLHVEREIAKVAVLGAMYGQTTGKGAEALAGLERTYPVAMGYLRDADVAAQGSNDLRTYGGRRVRMGATNATEVSERDARSRAAARGRYGRNAMVQGAAAEFFKTWAVLMRARSRHLDANIVLCLHDELLIHVPEANADAASVLLETCLQEAAHRWAPKNVDGVQPVRFVSDTSIIKRWSEAK